MGLQLEFHDNDVACLRFIKEYLEDGPNIYTADRLRRYATQETATYKAYDFLLVVSLRRYATQETATHKAYDFLIVVNRCTE